MSDAQLLAQLESERGHVLRTVDGLENDEMRRTLVPSGAAPMANGREILFRVLAETSVHAGHLDIVRELIDGHQNLVVE